MSVELFQEQYIYEVDYEGKHYSATITIHANGGYTESFVHDTEGKAVDAGLAMKVLEYVEANGGGPLSQQL